MIRAKFILIVNCAFFIYSNSFCQKNDTINEYQRSVLKIGINSFINYGGAIKPLVINVELNKFVLYAGAGYRRIPYLQNVPSGFFMFDKTKQLYVDNFSDRVSLLMGWQYFPLGVYTNKVNFYIDYNLEINRFLYIDTITFIKGKSHYYNNTIGVGTRINFLKQFFLTADAGINLYIRYNKSPITETFLLSTALNAKIGLGVTLFKIRSKNKIHN